MQGNDEDSHQSPVQEYEDKESQNEDANKGAEGDEDESRKVKVGKLIRRCENV